MYSIFHFIIKLIDLPKSIKGRIQKRCFAESGDNISVGQNCTFIYKHIYLGHHVHIGPGAMFLISVSNLYIGNFVTFGPNVTIIGGDHRSDVIGKHIYEVDEKLPQNDEDVIIDDGVWVGCNVTILKGTHINCGAIIAAGAVVTKSVPPYAIVGGNPARILKYRFSKEEILLHEKQLLTK